MKESLKDPGNEGEVIQDGKKRQKVY